MAIRIDGKAVAAEVKAEVARQVELLKARGILPCLATVLVGEDPASKIYLRNKKRACEETGIGSQEYVLPESASQEELLSLIRRLNDNLAVHGILVQFPLPGHLNEAAVVEAIDPRKDVDSFHAYNMGRLFQGNPVFTPCTPAGIIELLKAAGVELAGKRCVVVGRSNTVGKPLALLLLGRDATVTVCHSKTRGLGEVTRQADVLVCAVGKAKCITVDMVKPGAAVIDVGMNRNEQGKLSGDVDFENVEPIAGHITPVPGGVGPMTVAMLMHNTVTAAKLQAGKAL